MAETDQKPWTPLDSQIDYVCGLLEAMCWLWRDEDQDTVLRIITKKFTKNWPFIWRMFPAPHQELCARLFWDTVVQRYNRRCIHLVEVVFGETVNPKRDGSVALIRVQPAHSVEWIEMKIVLDEQQIQT